MSKASKSADMAETLVEVRVLNEYREAVGTEIINHLPGAILKLPEKEVARAPWCFKRLEEEKEDLRVSKLPPTNDEYFENSKKAQLEALAEQKVLFEQLQKQAAERSVGITEAFVKLSKKG